MICIIEDDSNIRELVCYTLKSSGYETVGFSSDKDFYSWTEENQAPKLLLLDIMLPDKDGLSILAEIRKGIYAPKLRQLPIIMLTAKDSEYDKVVALDGGADDYITKPFGMMELISRVRAMLRRSAVETPAKKVITYNNISLDDGSHEVKVEGKTIQLSLKEYNILKLLMENKGTVITRDSLLTKIWGYDFVGESRTVDVHIATLRTKLGDNGNCIKTIRGVGYKFD